MAKLSTHVLDIAQGKPAAGVKVALFSVTQQGKVLIKMELTNHEGRCSAALLEGDTMQAGQYELVFNAGDYFAAQGIALPTPRFIDLVTLAFGIADPAQHYHLPFKLTPWGYSLFRGGA